MANVQKESLRPLTVSEICDPIFTGSWTAKTEGESDTDYAKRLQQVVDRFTRLHKTVNTTRQMFDDALTKAQEKGLLTNVEHIRKPRGSKEDGPQSLDDLA